MSKKPSQTTLIYEHLCKLGSITVLEANKLYDTDRLAARIHAIKEKYRGMVITTDLKKANNGKHYTTYIFGGFNGPL